MVSAWAGLPLFNDNGFLTLTAEYKTQSAYRTPRISIRASSMPLVGGVFDPREATVNRFNAWTGEPEIEQLTLFANAGYSVDDTTELYGWASFQDREALSAGFFRRSLDDRNITSIYPDGFLPKIAPEVTDVSAAGGARFMLGAWDMDTSLVYGTNRMEFTIRDTLNRSIGPSSKTVFDAGGFEYGQVVFNFSGVRQYDMGLASPLNVAAGVEWRKESYEIFAGEPDSYRNGGVLLNRRPAPAPCAARDARCLPGLPPRQRSR